MRPRRLFAQCIATILICLGTASVPGQSPLRLSGNYAFGVTGGRPKGNCKVQNGSEIMANNGRFIFKVDGTVSWTGIEYGVCTGGAINSAPNQGNGTYKLSTEGLTTIDFDPTNPGTRVIHVHMRADRQVAIGAGHRSTGDPWVAILIKTSSGQSNQTMVGDHHLVRSVQINDSQGLATHTNLGVASFVGGGTYTEKGQAHGVSPTGKTVDSVYSSKGTFRVSADGSLTAGSASRPGAVASDGSAFFWVGRTGPRVELTIGLRRAKKTRYLSRDWRVAGFGLDLGSAATRPSFSSRFLSASFLPVTGTFSMLGSGLTQDQAGKRSGKVSIRGRYTMLADGSVKLDRGSSLPGIPGAVGAEGIYAILCDPDTGKAGIDVLVRQCAWPEVYGTSTAGTGGFRPVLESSGSAPYVGNAKFGVTVRNAVGGSVAGLGVAVRQSQGTPLLGGLLWIDPAATLLMLSSSLSGSKGQGGKGSANFSIPVPNNPWLDGAMIYLQAFVLDTGAVRGLAMSSGLSFTVGL